MTLGRRGVAFVAGGSRLVAYIIISQHPPWGVVVIAGVLAAFGEGLSSVQTRILELWRKLSPLIRMVETRPGMPGSA